MSTTLHWLHGTTRPRRIHVSSSHSKLPADQTLATCRPTTKPNNPCIQQQAGNARGYNLVRDKPCSLVSGSPIKTKHVPEESKRCYHAAKQGQIRPSKRWRQAALTNQTGCTHTVDVRMANSGDPTTAMKPCGAFQNGASPCAADTNTDRTLSIQHTSPTSSQHL